MLARQNHTPDNTPGRGDDQFQPPPQVPEILAGLTAPPRERKVEPPPELTPAIPPKAVPTEKQNQSPELSKECERRLDPRDRYLSEDKQVVLTAAQKRGVDLRMWIKASWELLRGMMELHVAGPCVTVFGSARLTEDHPEYGRMRELGAALAKRGFAVMTGGGPGIMEAANRGAREAGGRSFGCSINLPFETTLNQYMDKNFRCNYFFTRKVLLVKYSYAFVCGVGGLGTQDELFETATLIQTGKMKKFPIVLLGKEYWNPVVEQLKEDMLHKYKTISPEDLDMFFVTDSPDEAADHILDVTKERFHLTELDQEQAKKQRGGGFRRLSKYFAKGL